MSTIEDEVDQHWEAAVALVLTDRKCSVSFVQRKLGIGYNRAARLVERMEEKGIVSAANHVGKREVLAPEDPNTDSRPNCPECGGQGYIDHGHSITEDCGTCPGDGKLPVED